MDQSALDIVVQVIGGVIAGNLVGAVLRGGAGVPGRTLLGALGGAAAAYAAANFPEAAEISALWDDLIAGENGARLAQLITGAAGGAVTGLIGGAVLRPRL